MSNKILVDMDYYNYLNSLKVENERFKKENERVPFLEAMVKAYEGIVEKNMNLIRLMSDKLDGKE